MSADHPDLPIEQAHVDRAAAALEAMERRTRSAAERPVSGGSTRMTDRQLRELAERRLKRLLDARDGVCFGRIDGTDGSSWLVGLQHIHEGTEPLVISFESKVGGKFADASLDDPQGLKRRRRFNVVDGTKLLSLRDEMFDGSHPEVGGIHDAILESLVRERASEIRHIAATIERRQNRLIRFDRSGVLVVQGAPGTGKTVVALHRASWLAFTFERALGGSGGILVVGPNPTFMAYIESFLPGLGKRSVTQLPVASLGPTRGRVKESAESAALKGDVRMAEVLRRAAWSQIKALDEDTTIRVDLIDIVLRAGEIKELVRKVRTQRRSYMEAREEFRRLAGELFRERHAAALGRRTGSDDAAVSRFLRKPSGPWFNLIQRVWPSLAPEQLVHELYSVARRRRTATERLLDDHEAALIARPGVKRVGDQKWTAADAVLIDEAEFVLRGRQGGWRYVIVDEAQDLTPMQLRMVGRRSSTGDLTLVGDLAQATGPFRYASWHEVLAHIRSSKTATIEELSTGYRVPAQVLEYASQLIPEIAPDLEPPTSVRDGEEPWIEQVTEDVQWDVAFAAQDLVENEKGTIGIIAPRSHLGRLRHAFDDGEIAFGLARNGLKKRVTLLAADEAKGLEFDHVIVVEPSVIATERAQGLAELYVALTRPTQTLSVYHVEPLPPALNERRSAGAA
jgi:DNA helicase IV